MKIDHTFISDDRGTDDFNQVVISPVISNFNIFRYRIAYHLLISLWYAACIMSKNFHKKRKVSIFYNVNRIWGTSITLTMVTTIIFGIKIHGFIACWVWRSYYLANMPSISKELEAMIDWTSHLFFKRDVAMIERFVRDTSTNSTKDIRLLDWT